ncbi:drug resistance transporter, EmrB/QacA subfamily [Paenibacillus curdlanolyticus YK9]|uniref:Drug resistance transporter, EmrB/QacA subfamily n=1 Tax=Paenibacillus curdlanolyticus YK9 TaxID=717606 RepID=E0IF09_9BACL|nr:MFS transporter [Paenibacillus curdlanolyticus]EFM08785.1 drug resistance transporter, EmrB/QacA subfamily [Paenibacillus curdlanolyticus YK9]
MNTIESVPKGKRNNGWFFALLCLGVFVVYLDSTIVNVALPELQRSFGIGMEGLQWVVDGYAIAFACLLLSAGTIGDIVGHKRVFTIGMIGFTVFSICCGLSETIEWLIVSRFLQGTFGALLIPSSLAFIRHMYEDASARARAIGIWAGLGGLALAVGPLAGGWLVEAFEWESVFWINVPIGAVVVIVMLLANRETVRNAKRKLDAPGQLLFIATIGTLAYALIQGHSFGWGSYAIVGCFLTSGLLLVLFLLWESRVKEPLLPLQLFRIPAFAVACLVNFLGFFGFFAVVFLMTLYFQNVNGLSPMEAGVRFLSLNVSIMLASVIGSSLASRVRPIVMIPAGLVIMGACLFWLMMIAPDTPYVQYVGALAGIGVGISFAGSSATVALMSSVPLQWAGTASGVSNTSRQVSAVLGVALSGTFVSERLRHSTATMATGFKDSRVASLFTDGMYDTFLLAAIACFFAAVVAFALLASVARRQKQAVVAAKAVEQ